MPIKHLVIIATAILIVPFIARCQARLDFQVGAHRSTFVGMMDGQFGYLADARAVYQADDPLVYSGKILQRTASNAGLNYAIGIRKNLRKNLAGGIYLGYLIYKHEQYRYFGKSEDYPFASWPPGFDVYQGFLFRDNFVTLTGTLQYLVLKNIAVEVSPMIWRRESARYEASASMPDHPGSGLTTILKTNPDHASWGFTAKGGLLFYPQNDISFGVEHSWFISGINAQRKAIHKNWYIAWGVKLIYGLELK